MKLVEVTREQFPLWQEMRDDLYTGIDSSFHEREMEKIFNSEYLFCLLVVNDENHPLGFVELSLRNIVDGCLSSPVGYIEGLYLMPQYRGQQHGTELIQYLEAWFRNKGCTEMATDTEIENQKAQNFYNKVGFQEMWRIVEFKKSLN